MQSNLESLVRQMVDGHILYEEAVREVQKAFVRVALRETMATRAEQRGAWECTETRSPAPWSTWK